MLRYHQSLTTVQSDGCVIERLLGVRKDSMKGREGWLRADHYSYLRKHGFSMVRYHHGLVTVQSDGCVMEWLFGVLQDEIEICNSSFKYTPKIPGYKCSTNTWKTK